MQTERDSLAEHHARRRGRHSAAELRVRKLENLFELAPVGYLLLSADGQVEDANRAATALFGQPRRLLTGAHIQLLVRHEDRSRLDEHLRAVGAGYQELEVMALHSDGRQVPVVVRSTATLAPDGAVAGIQMAVMDVTAHKQAEAQLRQARDRLQHLAHHDALTGLPNRLLFGDRLRQAMLRARRRLQGVALLFIDLDDFKRVNDSLGHSAGDEVLCALAGRLTATVRAEDTVARMGGDEFTVILERIAEPAQAFDVARKLRAALREPYRIGEHEITVTASIGIAVYPRDDEELGELVRRADTAMFAAKERGKDEIASAGAPAGSGTLPTRRAWQPRIVPTS